MATMKSDLYGIADMAKAINTMNEMMRMIKWNQNGKNSFTKSEWDKFKKSYRFSSNAEMYSIETMCKYGLVKHVATDTFTKTITEPEWNGYKWIDLKKEILVKRYHYALDSEKCLKLIDRFRKWDVLVDGEIMSLSEEAERKAKKARDIAFARVKVSVTNPNTERQYGFVHALRTLE